MSSYDPADLRIFRVEIRVKGHRLLEDSLETLLAAYIEEEDVLRLLDMVMLGTEELPNETQDLPVTRTTDIRLSIRTTAERNSGNALRGTKTSSS